MTNLMKKRISMVGPDLEGLGGISKVARNWKDNNFFNNYSFQYFPSATDKETNKFRYLLTNLSAFTRSIIKKNSLIYIHVSSHNSFYRKSLFILISILFRRKFVLHIHPSHFHDFLCNTRGIKKIYVYFLLNKSQHFIVLTNDMKQKMEDLFPQKISHVLNNPVDLCQMTPKKEYTREDNSIVFLGWFIKAKGVFELVDAIEIVTKTNKKIHLHFYGTKQINELKAYIQKKKLTKHITVHGWINDITKVEVLAKCTCLVLPSYSEGIPNVILEAMASKTPIISTLVGGITEVLTDRHNAIITKVKDPQDLSEKISELIANSKLRDTISENAFHDVKNKYDIKVIKEKFSQIINTISE